MPPPPPPPPPIVGNRDDAVLKIKPGWYLHVLDNNANVTRVEVGPQTLTRKEHERVVAGPLEMVSIPPRHYAVISNPVLRDEEGNPTYDSYGQAKLAHAELEIRHAQDPFPLCKLRNNQAYPLSPATSPTSNRIGPPCHAPRPSPNPWHVPHRPLVRAR